MVLIDTVLRFSIKFKEISDTPSSNIFQAKLHKILIVPLRSIRERLFFFCFCFKFQFWNEKECTDIIEKVFPSPML